MEVLGGGIQVKGLRNILYGEVLGVGLFEAVFGFWGWGCRVRSRTLKCDVELPAALEDVGHPM